LVEHKKYVVPHQKTVAGVDDVDADVDKNVFKSKSFI